MIKADWLMSDIGVLQASLSEEAKEVLAFTAEQFLRAGGAVSWNMWSLLSPESRTAFVKAAERIQAEKAAQIALYTLQPEEAVKVLGIDLTKQEEEAEKK